MQRRLGNAWQLTGTERDQRAKTDPSQRKASRCSKEREHRALGDHLPHQPPLTGPEGRADGQLAISSSGAHQKKVGDVGAGDQQHREHDALQRIQRRARLADQLLADVDREAAEPARLREGLALRQPLHVAFDDHLHLPVELLDRGPRLQAGDHLAELVAAGLIRHLLRSEGERHVDPDIVGQTEVRGHHPDDPVGFAVDADVAPDERAIAAVAGLPQAVGQDHEVVGIRPGLVLGESPAEKRLALQGREERRRHHERAHLLRLTAVRQIRAAAGEERRILDGRRLCLAIDVVGDGNAGLWQPHQRIHVPDEDQPFGVRIRERAQQHLVEQAENGGVCADAQRQRQDGDEGEQRLLAQGPERVADVMHGRLDGKDTPGVALLLHGTRERIPALTGS